MNLDIDKILTIIANDDDLRRKFAIEIGDLEVTLGQPVTNFDQWIDSVQPDVDDKKISTILNIIANNDKSCTEIARQLGEPKSTFNQWIDTLTRKGQVRSEPCI